MEVRTNRQYSQRVRRWRRIACVVVTMLAITTLVGGEPAWSSTTTLSSPSTGILPTTPANTIRAYYQAINRRDYALASKFVAGGHAPYPTFAAGYKTTKHVAIDRLVVANYRITEPGATFACVGTKITALHTDGSVHAFGGWYMTFRQQEDFWRILIPGSNIQPGGALAVPSRMQCASRIPTRYRPSGQHTLLAAADFISPSIGWIVQGTSESYTPGGGCDQGIGSGCNTTTLAVLKTTDGGRNWTQQLRFTATPYLGTNGLPNVILLRFLNSRDGFLSVPTEQRHLPSGILYRTRDGGTNWRRLSLPGAPGDFTGSPFSFIDPQHGWLLANVSAAMGKSSASIYRTDNGGTSWQEISYTDFRHPTEGPGLGGDKVSLVFRSRTVGWLTAGTAIAPLIAVTYDGGIHWYHQTLAPVVQPSPKVSFAAFPGVPQCFNARDCIDPITAHIYHLTQHHTSASPDRLYVYNSHNGGSSWPTLHQLPGFGTAVAPLTWDFLDPSHCWVSGGDHIWISRNGGRTWTKHGESRPSGLHIVHLDFVDPTHGWALATSPGAGGDFARRAALLQTPDAGVHWTESRPAIRDFGLQAPGTP